MSSNITLYEVAAEYRDMAERLADLELDEQTVLDTLEAESGALVTKAANVAFVARNLEAGAEAIKQAEAAMAARRRAIENRAKRLRAYLLDGMVLAGVQKIDSPYFALSIKKNPPSVDVFDPNQVPQEYLRTPEPPPPEPDKSKIGAALKLGQDIAGCRLVQGQRLDIK